MAASDTLRLTLINNSQSWQNVYTGANGIIELSLTAPTGNLGFEVLCAFGYATLQLFFIVSPQNLIMSVNAIHSGSPLFSVSLLANVPYYWGVEAYYTNPFGTTNCTSLWFDNTSGTSANVVGEVIY